MSRTFCWFFLRSALLVKPWLAVNFFERIMLCIILLNYLELVPNASGFLKKTSPVSRVA